MEKSCSRLQETRGAEWERYNEESRVHCLDMEGEGVE